MKRERMAARGIVLAVMLFLCWQAKPAAAQDAQAQQPAYTIPEYNAFQACRAETNGQTRLKCLDDFVSKFPKSTLMKYIDQMYWSTYNELKNYAKVVEFSDKYIAESDPKADNMNDQQFADQKKPVTALFYSTMGFAELQLKDYPTAATSFKAALANVPADGVSEYRLG